MFQIQNPFSALGLQSLKIVNRIQFCEDQADCGALADFEPDDNKILPDVLAFFIPTSENFTGGELPLTVS